MMITINSSGFYSVHARCTIGMRARRIACGSVYRRLQLLWTVLPERLHLVQPHVHVNLLQDVSAADRACTDVVHGAWHLRRWDGRVKDARR